MKMVKKLSLLSGIVFLLFLCLFLLITTLLYQKIFDRRFEGDSNPLALTLEDFKGLKAAPVVFKSGNDLLRGNFYSMEGVKEKEEALIIFCHGFSNGSRDYLSQIAYLAEHGFEVLAYDNTGCHNSTGEGVRGMPQAVVNLSDVLDSLHIDSAFEEYHRRPIVLMGHSWGGYAVNAVLNHKKYDNVKAVVSFSAPDKSLDMLMAQGKQLFGKKIYLLKPFVWFVERFKFGDYAGYSSLDGVNNTAAYVLAFHSKDDIVVSYEHSLVSQWDKVRNPNTKMMAMENRGHKVGVTKEARGYEQYLKEYISERENGGSFTVSQLEELLADADKMQLYQLDEEVLGEVVEFVQKACIE